MARSDKRPWIVYGIYAGGDLQYIGITTNLARRTYQHQYALLPGQQVEARVLERAHNEAEAKQRERARIKRHCPPLNRAHNPKRPRNVRYVRTTRVGPSGPIEVTMRLRVGMMHPDDARETWFNGDGTGPERAKVMGWSLGQAYFVFGPFSNTPSTT